VRDAGFRLWHWYDNCKNRNGEVEGFRAEVWYIARKFKWKPASVTKMNGLLFELGYLTWRAAHRSSKILKALAGSIEPQTQNQKELPFLVPVVNSKNASPGDLENFKNASGGNPEMPLGDSKNASGGFPYKKCDLVIKECDVPPVREGWKIEKELTAVRAEIERTREEPASPTRKLILEGLKKRERNLRLEYAGIRPS